MAKKRKPLGPLVPIKLGKRAILRAYGIKSFSALKIWEGPSAFDGEPIMVLLSNYATNTGNEKIGKEFAQVWILPMPKKNYLGKLVDILPREAYEKKSPTVCGTCSHLGQGCYVVWSRLKALYDCGKVQKPLLDRYGGRALLRKLIAGQYIRLGAAGDPLAMPLEIAKLLTDGAKRFTGYTHAWYNLEIPNHDEWQGLVMASVDSEKERKAAKYLGWRTFRTIKGDLMLGDKEIQCLADSPAKKSCATCGLCNGKADPRIKKDIAINVHGLNLYRYKVDDYETSDKFAGVRSLIELLQISSYKSPDC